MIRKLWKDETSGDLNCPTLYAADRDGKVGYIVQGKLLTVAETRELDDVAPDETAVWVPANVLDRLPAGI